MNWGYDSNTVSLETVEKLYPDSVSKIIEKYSLQLYHFVVKDINMEGKIHLDISSGKGGGINYLNSIKKPKLSIGVDFTFSNIQFCKNNFQHMTFRQENALNLPFENDYADVITNVEASHCYPDIDKFFSEVNRCLVGGGYFAYTDFGRPEKYALAREKLGKNKLNILQEENITKHVLKSMEAVSEEKEKLIGKYGGKFIEALLKRFTSVKNSSTYNKFIKGEYVYFYFLCQK